MLPASTSAFCRSLIAGNQTSAAQRNLVVWWQKLDTKHGSHHNHVMQHRRFCASQPTEPVLKYESGMPVITLQLPSRRELCQFTLKPVSNTVGDLITYVKAEDKGIDFVAVYNADGARMAHSTPIEHILRLAAFRLRVNDDLIDVEPLLAPGITEQHAQLSTDTVKSTDQLKSMVASLHATLNVDDHQLRIEQQLLREIENVKEELKPLEEARKQIAIDCDKRTQRILWGGLAAMGIQWGAFARLTWWEYSWDIMEPVTYFATYSTAIVAFMYFMVTQQSYEYPDARDRLFLRAFHKRAKALNFDLNKYNALRERLFTLEHDLKRVRDPMYLHLPLDRLYRLGRIMPK